jgi:hypothetical protein
MADRVPAEIDGLLDLLAEALVQRFEQLQQVKDDNSLIGRDPDKSGHPLLPLAQRKTRPEHG